MSFTDLRRRGALMGLAALLVLGGCNRSSEPAKPETHAIVMDQMVYGPTVTQAKVGDVIVWTNKDVLKHTATAKDGQFDVDLDPQATARTTLTKPGTIQVYCRYHPGMTAQIQVAG